MTPTRTLGPSTLCCGRWPSPHPLAQRRRICGERIARTRPGNRRERAVDDVAHFDADTVDRWMEHLGATRAAVTKENDRVHAPRLVGGVGLRHVKREAVMERDTAAWHLDVHRLDAARLRRFHQVVGLAEKDIDELAHA